MEGWLRSLQPWSLLLMRLVLGAAMAYSGWPKIAPMHGDLLAGERHFNAYVASLGIPGWLGYVSTATEFLGGLLLEAGLWTRPVAGLVTINMLVALSSVNLHHGFAASQYTLALIAMAAVLATHGGGAASVDRRRR